jgi:hypothetical protein
MELLKYAEIDMRSVTARFHKFSMHRNVDINLSFFTLGILYNRRIRVKEI